VGYYYLSVVIAFLYKLTGEHQKNMNDPISGMHIEGRRQSAIYTLTGIVAGTGNKE
jgi:hypothetical protein